MLYMYSGTTTYNYRIISVDLVYGIRRGKVGRGKKKRRAPITMSSTLVIARRVNVAVLLLVALHVVSQTGNAKSVKEVVVKIDGDARSANIDEEGVPFPIELPTLTEAEFNKVLQSGNLSTQELGSVGFPFTTRGAYSNTSPSPSNLYPWRATGKLVYANGGWCSASMIGCVMWPVPLVVVASVAVVATSAFTAAVVVVS